MADDNTILARLKVQNRAGFVSDLKTASKAVLGFGVANEEAAAETRLAAVESFGLRQGLFTLRRELFYSTAAVIGGASALLHMGFAFDSAKQEGMTAFTAILGSTQAARREMSALTKVSLETGLSLSTVADSAKTMQSFGFNIRAVNTDIRALGDFSERSGASLTSLVDVWDQIQSSGRLTSRNILMLTRQGVPALQILTRQLHLTALQAAQLQQGKLIIPARYALPALTAGVQRRANQLGPTLSQEVGRTHSALADIFGSGEGGIFSGASGLLARFNASLNRGIVGMRNGGGVQGLLTGIDPSGRLLIGWKILAGGVKDVASAVRLLWMVAKPVVTVLAWLIGGTAALAAHSTFLRVALYGLGGILKILTALYIVDRVRLLGVWAAQKLLKDETIASTVVMRAAAAATRLWTGALLLLDVAATPVVLTTIAIIAFGAAMYVLYTHADRVRAVFSGLIADIRWLRNQVLNISVRFHVGPIGQGLLDQIPGVGPLLSGIHDIRGLAGGGNLRPGETAVVGENAPELARNVGGVTQVIPLSRQGSGGGLAERIAVLLQGDVNIDGRRAGDLIARRKQIEAAIA